jgi:aryl-alcohol dehydrogenase-like predicted oxidoreductase
MLTSDQRQIADMQVSAIALGGASWSLTDIADRAADHKVGRTDVEAAKTVHAAIDAGVTLIDTARVYTTATHPGHNEALIRRALAAHEKGSGVVIATKGGHYRSGDNFPVCASPQALKSDCEASRALFAVDRIDLYQLHYPDSVTPLEASIEALVDLREEGSIRHIGVSNVTLDQLKQALSVTSIASVQNHFSPLDQSDRAMIDYCAEHSIAYLAYSPLGGGAHGAGRTAIGDAFPAAAAAAERHGISLQQLALGWMLGLSPTLIPICGANRPESIRDSVLAGALALSADELAALDFGTAA